MLHGKQINLTNTSLCIDVPNNAPANGRKLWVYSCNGSAAQQWNVQGVITSTLRPSSNTNVCLDVRSSETTDGTAVQIWPCQGTQVQLWPCNGSAAQTWVAK